MNELRETITLNNLEYVITYKLHEVHVDFTVYKVASWTDNDNGEYTVQNFVSKDRKSDMVKQLQEAEKYFQGEVKWDGCSNIDFNLHNHTQSHFCGKKDAVNVGNVISHVYDKARELMGPDVVHDVGLYEDL